LDLIDVAANVIARAAAALTGTAAAALLARPRAPPSEDTKLARLCTYARSWLNFPPTRMQHAAARAMAGEAAALAVTQIGVRFGGVPVGAADWQQRDAAQASSAACTWTRIT
jgi:hypothetical protein